MRFFKNVFSREDERSKNIREKSLRKYIYNTEYFEKLTVNQDLFESYYKRSSANKIQINHDIELWCQTLGIESISKTFNTVDLMKYLSVLANDIDNNGRNAKVSDIVGWFQHNIMEYFLNETKIEKFAQEYFIEDCFRLICDQLALKIHTN